MEPKLERTSSIRAVDEAGVYYDVDFFAEISDDLAEFMNGKAPSYALRVNRQAAKQLDEMTYEIIATGVRLRRVSLKTKSGI